MFDPNLVLGQVVDRRYRLVRFCGSGAFGWVFAAEELVGGDPVGMCAVKFLKPRTSEARQTALQEMRAGAALTRGHSGLVSYLAFGQVEDEGLLRGALFLAMELAEDSLGHRLSRPGRGLSPEEVGSVARDLAEALAWLHGQGAVHRDVKPDNVLRSGDRWKLGDLGLVKAVEGSRMAASGQKGTPLYLAPEAMENLVGPSLDVWALGALLQQCLTGVLPYDAPNEAALYGALMTREPTIAPGLPAPLDGWCGAAW